MKAKSNAAARTCRVGSRVLKSEDIGFATCFETMRSVVNWIYVQRRNDASLFGESQLADCHNMSQPMPVSTCRGYFSSKTRGSEALKFDSIKPAKSCPFTTTGKGGVAHRSHRTCSWQWILDDFRLLSSVTTCHHTRPLFKRLKS